MTVFVTRRLPQKALDKLADHTEVDLWEDELPPPYDDLRARTAHAEGLLCLLTDKVDTALLEASPNLKVVSNLAVGFDNIDTTAATARGIPVGHTPHGLTESSADFAFALLMAAARRIPNAEHYVKDGHWKTWGPLILLGQDVHGATLGVIGMGRIGSAVARRGKFGFGMKIIYHGGSNVPDDLDAEHRDLPDLLREADFISINTPLTPETRGLIDADAFALMKPSAVIVNTARGAVIDTDALYDALAEKRIFAAALDVTDPEPLPADHKLLTLENCLVVPHIASASFATRERIALMAVDNVLAALRGERMAYCANPSVYEA